MYGSKSAKRQRLERLAALVALAPQGVTQATLAKALGVDRATVMDDVAALERLGSAWKNSFQLAFILKVDQLL